MNEEMKRRRKKKLVMTIYKYIFFFLKIDTFQNVILYSMSK